MFCLLMYSHSSNMQLSEHVPGSPLPPGHAVQVHQHLAHTTSGLSWSAASSRGEDTKSVEPAFITSAHCLIASIYGYQFLIPQFVNIQPA